ncbi:MULTISPECIES: transglycosylase domain-containing protein [Planktothricoides]|uniref:Penicillin-binding protein 1A n=2 Tax=Planktothricoides raciborskii TaxID=132608 RepID=A0AAU8J897_9CYAN|nr:MULTISPECIES: penicillin-binding protein 1A [Planktothricoides]KOR34106.1 penicillin-binding protein [Planktothricoides sp. SR001]MBD2543827.1 penicillin-binding protein 1A [Planktothricoides raciborskii FACHB-1370]MBD2583109.1 penicillin-binding protein 1A [Planktothricoides raciborskii FACHB-1261]
MSTNTIPQNPPRDSAPVFNFLQDISKVTAGTLLGVTMLASSVVAGGLVGLAISFRNLPDVRVLRSYVPAETTHIYDIKGRLLTSLHDEANREVVPLNKISPNLKRAVMAIEDSHFYQHHGINPGGVMRALAANLEANDTVEGGSTLTMQLVKNLFLSPKRALSRKAAEAVLSIRLEQIFTKDQIMELYLNQVYWGHNLYGVETAARSYFNKSAADLNLAEAAMMAGIIQAPEEYSPFTNYKLAKQRQATVLDRMVTLKWITAEEAESARQQPLLLGRITSFGGSKLPYVTEAVVQELNQRFGREAVLKGGMRVQTTIDMNFQRMAERTIRGWHEQFYNQGVFYDRDNGQIALVAVDPRTHFVKAMVGGADFEKSQYNRAIQAQRQPGSAFKPFVYYTAFASGKYAPSSVVYDSPVSYRDGDGYYSPQNYGGSFSGAVSIRKALEVSLNIPAVKIGQEVGLNKVVEVCRVIGFKSPITPVISLPLGAVDVTPLEMAGAYATFASNGWYSEPTSIVQVTDSNGKILLDNTPKRRLVLDPWSAASINDVLQGVISQGTATQAQIGRPAAGKTGTTSSERDVWFVGYVPQLTVAVWVGNDDYTPMPRGTTGGGFVAPIWRDFMQQALQGVPAESFTNPWVFEPPK